MKCLKADDYIKRTDSVEETRRLYQELETYVKGNPGLQGRTLCDRIIRACNHQLGAGHADPHHIGQLVKLVELSLHGYDMSAALVPQSSQPLYMEKIIFHIVKKLTSLRAHSLCSSIAALLYSRLHTGQQSEDYSPFVLSCFSLLWTGLAAAKDGTILNPREKLHCQMQAVSFLLLLDAESASSPVSKVPTYLEGAIQEFQSSSGALTNEYAPSLLQEVTALFNRCRTGAQDCAGAGSRQFIKKSTLYVLFEVLLIFVRSLCESGHYELAYTLLSDVKKEVRDDVGRECTVLQLGSLAVEVHAKLKAGEESDQALTSCARALRSLPSDLGAQEAHAAVEVCGLVVWSVENGHGSALSGPVLLAWFSFLEEHQELILKMLKKNLTCQIEDTRLQRTLCSSILHGFAFACESMLASQLENSDTLDRVLLYCQSTAGQMMTEIRKLPSESLLIKAVISVTNLVCGLYNRRFYDQAFTLIEIICRDLCKNSPDSLSVDRLCRPFMLAVQTSRRAGKLEQALDWVILWLKALGDNIPTHMAEPVSLWVKTKIDAARNEDIRLRTLRDGFGPDVPEENVMVGLLEEELRVYKEVAGDTAQERYNTLCDLLEICHEESSETHQRAVYLTEMAQVVCFQDFSEQTDCSAVDFTHEALRLLEEEAVTAENADRLKDDKAHASLWLFICTLEKNLQEAIEKDKNRRELREQTECVTNPIGTNDFDYEDKQKSEDSILLYEGLHFNLAAEHKLCTPLERALDEWSALLQTGALPLVRSPKQTCSSIALTASLFRLMGKPLKALEALQLATGLSHHLSDEHSRTSFLCQSASLLMDVGAPELALTQLEQAEKSLAVDTSSEGPSSLSMLPLLLKAQYYYNMGQVDDGLPYLCKVLKEVNEQRQSKSWYLLRARAMQTCSSYLSLDTTTLPQAQRAQITVHGIHSPDSALYESLKLLCSLLLTLVGKGLYGNNGSSSDVRFIDQGDNLMVKWQLLSELLNCSVKMVAFWKNCGAIKDARLQCLEALKLAIKLQALSQCAELLVMKAELELMQGEKEESRQDLENVRNLLELCTDFSDNGKKPEVKIKPRKGRPAKKSPLPLPSVEDDFKDILSICWIAKEPIVRDLSTSPPLKAQPRRWLSSLAHESNCPCSCCSEPCLSHATAHWAATQADLVLKLDPADAKVSLKLQLATLTRCKNITARLGAKLAKLFPSSGPTKDCIPSLMQDVVGRMYLHMALSGLEPRFSSIWKILEAGLAYVESMPSPLLRPVRAGLMAAKAIMSLVTMASKKGCDPEELFSQLWSWNAPKDLKQNNFPAVLLSKKSKDAVKNSDAPDKTKKPTRVKAAKPKTEAMTSLSKGRGVVPMTPVAVRSKPCVQDVFDRFDFNTEVPTLACTPMLKGKAPSSVRNASRTASKQRFHVFEDGSPTQPVPAAPRRTKTSRFKMDFSDESDAEVDARPEPKEKRGAPKKQTKAQSSKVAPGPPPESKAPKRPVRGKKSTSVPKTSSCEDSESSVCQPATRRGRSRREVDTLEEPEKLRTIEEEHGDVLEMSFEQLRTTDAETDDNPASSQDFEILRKDICSDLRSDGLSTLRSQSHLKEGPHIQITPPDTRPENLSMEEIESLLRSAWLDLQHFPSPTLHPTLSTLLALSLGQRDPVATAMLHAQSFGITSRHRTVRHLASLHKKLKKSSSELTDKMEALTLTEGTSTASRSSAEHRLTQMEEIFSFPTADSSSFPKSHCQEFVQQLEHLPQGVTVCMMSALGVKPGEMGDGILLSRLQKGSAPVSVHISTSMHEQPMSSLVQEMDSILREQKVVSCVTEKAKWWDGRRALDARVEKLLKEMERSLGCWKSLLLPHSSHPELSHQAQRLCKALSAIGVTASEEMLKPLLSAFPALSQEDLQKYALGFSSCWGVECYQLLHKAWSQVSDRDEPQGHVVLVLDKYLQKLPWESIPSLKFHSVSRMPSLHSLIGLSVQKEIDSNSILRRGVDNTKVFYVLDPDANLGSTQETFKELFSSKPDWEGVCGVAPNTDEITEAVANNDLYIYVGHGAGARFLDNQAVLKREMRAASLLFGCSSAALAVRGDQEGQGIVLSYLIAGCPFVLGNLWDVTDGDINRFTKALLESWLNAGSGAPILDHMGPSRQATYLKHLIGAAPVVYGLPVHLH